MKIVPISVPTPFYVGSVNVYLIREDPLTLIDVGPKTKDAARVLREKLGRASRYLDTVRGVGYRFAED